jgi:prepilin-type N-terminal cleavage/methylation domain-containing protein/prepilin-type processing-associated H-X9-DG protein
LGLASIAALAIKEAQLMISSRFSTRGFTLIEVLIVIAIIGLLVSLSVPAIQASREAARRTQCSANLRQLGIAFQSYHDVHRLLPPMVIWRPAGEPLGEGIIVPGVIDRLVRDDAAGQPDRVYANWLCMLLPFLEESALHSRIDFSVPIGDSRNAAARATDLPVLLCGSDGYNGSDNHYQRIPEFGSADEGYARNNYGMNFGTNDACLVGDIAISPMPTGQCTDGFWVDGSDFKTNTRRVWGSGIGGVNMSMSFKSFSRGLSTMVALDEIRAGVNAFDPRGVWALGFVGASATAGHGKYANAGRPNNSSVDSDRIANCEKVRMMAGGAAGLAAMGMGCNPWKIPGCNFEAGARSLHPGGANVLMLGGSVHFIEDGIDEDLWHNMHRRDFRDPLELPF